MRIEAGKNSHSCSSENPQVEPVEAGGGHGDWKSADVYHGLLLPSSFGLV